MQGWSRRQQKTDGLSVELDETEITGIEQSFRQFILRRRERFYRFEIRK
jgi:hypothetical protein